MAPLASSGEAEREALEAFIGSAGWRIFCAMVIGRWGDTAVVQQIRSALAPLERGNEAAERSTTAQVLAAQKQILTLLAWPSDRLKEIEKMRVQAETGRRTAATPRRTHRHGIGTDVTGEPR